MSLLASSPVNNNDYCLLFCLASSGFLHTAMPPSSGAFNQALKKKMIMMENSLKDRGMRRKEKLRDATRKWFHGAGVCRHHWNPLWSQMRLLDLDLVLRPRQSQVLPFPILGLRDFMYKTRDGNHLPKESKPGWLINTASMP